ncbi:MAG: helix-turn-helix transcriptional regulator [Bacteroidetes bacterium]|nr:helix-turn-helix transcriptional regulator [Bacteroidota bacterium]
MAAKQNQTGNIEQPSRLEVCLLKDGVALSRRELKVLGAALEGKPNNEIAEELVCSLATVKTHKNRLIAKLGLQGRCEFHQFLLHLRAKLEKIQPLG